ncbi:hypothetical protein [Streptomyces sp. UH6]|uniref:hypothetical protein n=1 Tax=Streptomyces sp. UH6 TaxID=2748379 RepID=UPI0015D472EE|nr:hypothetical protein [Streptomyces sp. UH6]NYV73263.1 hypothetical protein [Streptomyces sp. UH6]
MPDPDLHPFDPGRLASFADVLAGELPGTWRSIHHFPPTAEALAAVADRTWDLDLVAESLATHPPGHLAVLTREDGAQLVLLDRHDGRDGFLTAALAPEDLPAEAFRGIREPNGIALGDDPFLAAEMITGDLLARYEAAVAQVRVNAARLADPSGTELVHPSQPERLVLTWQSDGDLAASPATEAAAAILLANGFTHDERTGVYRLSGDDTAVQARAVRRAGSELAARGIATALAPPAAPPATTVSTPTPRPAKARAATGRSR